MRITDTASTGFDARARMQARIASSQDIVDPGTADQNAVAPVTAVTAPPRSASAGGYQRMRPDAGLIAQLLATRAGLPQTRARRRETPLVACESYETTRLVVQAYRARPAQILKIDC